MSEPTHAFGPTLVFLGLCLAVLIGTGCPKLECLENTDCGEDKLCSDEGRCEAIDADPCDGLDCPGGQHCAAGVCVGTCCEPSTCPSAGAFCDEERCLAGVGPCFDNGLPCDPPCAGDFICNLVTLECEPPCLHLGCPEVNERCNAVTGACEVRPPAEEEIGYPCGEQGDPLADAECDEICGPWGFCSKSCSRHSDCGAGAFCLTDQLPDGSGFCWAACDELLGADCPHTMQCVVLGHLEYPACYVHFQVSGCEADCIGRGESCDTAVPDQCEAKLACVELSEDEGGICRQIQCGLPSGECEVAGEICLEIGDNLSVCVDQG